MLDRSYVLQLFRLRHRRSRPTRSLPLVGGSFPRRPHRCRHIFRTSLLSFTPLPIQPSNPRSSRPSSQQPTSSFFLPPTPSCLSLTPLLSSLRQRVNIRPLPPQRTNSRERKMARSLLARSAAWPSRLRTNGGWSSRF